ncbi:hypothetical protein L332_03500 [Agrococcus pavilionensis RW1]|uniref:Cell wall-binding repeat 2 family protein n=1 Tax=Agrococcus pavilionensis RW1 TaxID=1330458 RepID=U1LMF4_9MICO|nr:cell wall-binding repeat-containing protein [Agrococcus pavilionensis]ERG63519.1 hypothetical protein L332_03500 [Agrococcus pavilionensis RW1]
MKVKHKLAAIAASAALVFAGATTAAADPLPGYECRSVFTGGGWISFCTYVGEPPAEPVPSTITRIAGVDRYATSALLSQETFAPGVEVVYIANGVTLVDALGAGAASQGRGPVLAVPREGTLPAPIAAELERLDPASIVIVGDPQSVSDAMAVQVEEAAAR